MANLPVTQVRVGDFVQLLGTHSFIRVQGLCSGVESCAGTHLELEVSVRGMMVWHVNQVGKMITAEEMQKIEASAIPLDTKEL